MRRTFQFLIVAAALSATLLAGAYLDFFQGRSDGGDITLEWRTRSENNLLIFEVQRKAGWNGDFQTIGTVQPKDQGAFYTYIDRSAYKTSDNVYIYRLRIVENGGAASFSIEVPVTHSVSSVKRTWGSIKAMFR